MVEPGSQSTRSPPSRRQARDNPVPGGASPMTTSGRPSRRTARIKPERVLAGLDPSHEQDELFVADTARGRPSGEACPNAAERRWGPRGSSRVDAEEPTSWSRLGLRIGQDRGRPGAGAPASSRQPGASRAQRPGRQAAEPSAAGFSSDQSAHGSNQQIGESTTGRSAARATGPVRAPRATSRRDGAAGPGRAGRSRARKADETPSASRWRPV